MGETTRESRNHEVEEDRSQKSVTVFDVKYKK